LAHTLAGEADFLTNLFQCFDFARKPEAHFQNRSFSLGKAFQHLIDFFTQQLLHDLVIAGNEVLISPAGEDKGCFHRSLAVCVQRKMRSVGTHNGIDFFIVVAETCRNLKLFNLAF
jgi:hypothetical protein